MRPASVLVLLATVLAPVAASAEPRPDDRVAAETLFREARRLMEAGQHPEACRKLEESQRLDPAPGTLLNLGVCHEAEGRIATAWAELQQALAQARRDARADRETLARERIAAIEPELPRMTLYVPAGARIPGLSVSRNGSPLKEAAWGTPIPVDPGEVVVEASAPGFVPWRRVIPVQRRAQLDVSVPILERVPPPPAAPEPAPPASSASSAPPRTSVRAPAGLVLVGAGVLSAGIGAYFGLRAVSKRNESDVECPIVGGRERCSVAGKELNDQARSAARTADVGIGVGLLLVGAGAYLYLGDPDRRADASGRAGPARLVASAAPGFGFVGVRGGF